MSVWYATPATGATFRRHLLRAGSNEALCGEWRRTWWPVENFARPHVFVICVDCALEAL